MSQGEEGQTEKGVSTFLNSPEGDQNSWEINILHSPYV